MHVLHRCVPFKNQLAFLGNGISTIGFPCNDVYNITVHTYIHTYVRSVSSSDSFTAPILKNPPPTATHQNFFSPVFHLLFIKNKNGKKQNITQNVSQALSENKAIGQASSCSLNNVQAENKKTRKEIVQNHPAERKISSFLLACNFFFLIFMSLSSYFFHLKRFCQAIKRTRVPLSLAY